jgi:hypothetical protein
MIYKKLLTVLYRALVLCVGQEKINAAVADAALSGGRMPAGGALRRLVFFLARIGFLDHFRAVTGLDQASASTSSYTENYFHLRLNRVYDLPRVEVSQSAVRYVNVLVPAFSISSISAGFFGVFAVARLCARLGYRTRLVFFDNFVYSDDDFRAAMKKFPAFQSLCDEVDLHYIGERLRPLVVSPHDQVIATVWYSAHFASAICGALKRPFLYLVQDYETVFFPSNSLFTLADQSYSFNYRALVSTRPLLEFMRAKFPQQFAEDKAVDFNNSCTSRAPNPGMLKSRLSTRKRRCVFYSRPVVDRNMFELSCLTLIAAYKEGVFAQAEWEIYGIGLGQACIELSDGRRIEQLPRMTLEEYELFVGSVDLCLTLMASPHPSLIPFDMAASGAIVVTNSFATKTPEYFASVSANIICRPPTLQELTAGMREAIRLVEDATYRVANSAISFPKSWDEAWSEAHQTFINDLFEGRTK